MGSDGSRFNVSLIVRDKVTRRCPQSTTFEEKGEPKRIRTEVPLLTSLTQLLDARPNRLTASATPSFYLIRSASACCLAPRSYLIRSAKRSGVCKFPVSNTVLSVWSASVAPGHTQHTLHIRVYVRSAERCYLRVGITV